MNGAREGERGMAMLMVIAMVAVTAGAIATFHALFDVVVKDTAHERGAIAALYVAEGGLAAARVRLKADPSYAGEVVKVGGGEAAVRVGPAAGPGESFRVVYVRGSVPNDMSEGGQTYCAIEAEVRLVGATAVVECWRQE